MKKLTVSIAATAMLMGVTSCGDVNFVPPYVAVEEKVAEYSDNFIETFGEIDPKNDWGFSYVETSSPKTRGVNAKANQWFTGEGGATPVYEVDPNVTSTERNGVFNYVNKDVDKIKTVEQPNWTEYFVTQVWKGNLDEAPDGSKTPQSTSYPNQNGQTTTIDGAANMDQLEAQLADGSWEHIYNFNNASNGNTVEDPNGNKIVEKMLMVESGTTSFRYNNSQSSFQSEKYIVVSGADIFGKDSDYAGYYYVCFDFEKGYSDSEKASEKTAVNLKCKYQVDIPAATAETEYKTYVVDKTVSGWDPSDYWIAEQVTGIGGADQSSWIINITKTIESNGDRHYTGTIQVPVGGGETSAQSYTENYNQVVIIDGFYDANSLTSIEDVIKKFKNLPEYATVTVLSDEDNTSYSFVGYQYGQQHFDGDNFYTDWIVRISPAIVKGEEPEPEIKTDKTPERIICEDMGSIGDYDFNDLVLDVENDGVKTTLTFQAAGATYNIWVGYDNKKLFEVHDVFDVNPGKMVNTGAGPTVTPQERVINDVVLHAKDIQIWVENVQMHATYELSAAKGEAPQMVCVGTDYKFTTESQSILNKYPKFADYVGNMEGNKNWWK